MITTAEPQYRSPAPASMTAAGSSSCASSSRNVLQLRHLCACLAHGTPHRIAPEDSIGNMRVLDAVRASMRSGEPQHLKERDS
ncbi:MAG: hypothetical protein FJX53_14430 [Alphaproteobacteria bacterium]|nr:hypothetical protein [Alphaproteobacteria bacterium]